MKRRFTLLFILLFLNILAQNIDLSVNHNEIIVGTNYLKGTNIKGNEFIFPCPVYNSNFDTTNHKITLLLRYLRNNQKSYKNKGYLAVYDLENKKVQWSQKTNTFNIIMYPNNGENWTKIELLGIK